MASKNTICSVLSVIFKHYTKGDNHAFFIKNLKVDENCAWLCIFFTRLLFSLVGAVLSGALAKAPPAVPKRDHQSGKGRTATTRRTPTRIVSWSLNSRTTIRLVNKRPHPHRRPPSKSSSTQRTSRPRQGWDRPPPSILMTRTVIPHRMDITCWIGEDEILTTHFCKLSIKKSL
jgi:hypothetical protein